MKKSALIFLCLLFIQGGAIGRAQSPDKPLPLPPGAHILSPGDQALRPAIYAGPFTGPNLDQIRVLLNATTKPWSYGGYFQGHADAATFKRYVGDPLPQAAPTTVKREPAAKYNVSFTPGGTNGEPKTAPGSVLMALSLVQYSSRYGGSVRLAFKLVDDVGVELVHGRSAWDFRDLTMNIYVAPKIDWLNRGISYVPAGEGLAGVEFSTAGVAQYEISGNNALPNPLVATATDRDLLRLALGNLATVMRTKLGEDAVRFASGFLRSVLKNEIAFGNLVDSLALSDNWVEVKTHAAQAYVTVYWRGGDITASGYNPFESEYEFRVTLSPGAHFLGTLPPSIVSLPAHVIELSSGDMSYAVPLVTWKPADLESWLAADAPHSLWGILTAYTIVEQSPTGDREFTVNDGYRIYGLLPTIVDKARRMEPFMSEKQVLELPLAGIAGTSVFAGTFTTEYWIVLSYR